MEAMVSITPAADPRVRRSGIGSSDAPIVAGLSSYATQADLYLEKRGLAQRDVPDNVMEAAEWGTIMEPVILRQYALRNSVHVIGRDERGTVTVWDPEGNPRPTRDGTFIGAGPEGKRREIPITVWEAMAGTARHPEREWMMFHPDGLALSTDLEPVQLLEAKTASEWVSGQWGDEDTDQVPPAYLVQVQHGAEVMRGMLGAALPIRVPVVQGGNRFRVYRLELHADLVEDLVELERRFWLEAVQAGEMPPIQRNALGLETLKRLYPEDSGAERLVPKDHRLHQAAVELAQVSAEVKLLEQTKDALNVELQEAMGTTTKLVGEGWSYTWKRVAGRVSHKTVAQRLAQRYGIPSHELEELEEASRGEPTRRPFPYLRNLVEGS